MEIQFVTKIENDYFGNQPNMEIAVSIDTNRNCVLVMTNRHLTLAISYYPKRKTKIQSSTKNVEPMTDADWEFLSVIMDKAKEETVNSLDKMIQND
jgi:hypothetical protein